MQISSEFIFDWITRVSILLGTRTFSYVWVISKGLPFWLVLPLRTLSHFFKSALRHFYGLDFYSINLFLLNLKQFLLGSTCPIIKLRLLVSSHALFQKFIKAPNVLIRGLVPRGIVLASFYHQELLENGSLRQRVKSQSLLWRHYLIFIPSDEHNRQSQPGNYFVAIPPYTQD